MQNMQQADLDGFQQVPAVITTGTGNIEVDTDDEAGTITYTLRFSQRIGRWSVVRTSAAATTAPIR
jgi:hypothetical protein